MTKAVLYARVSSDDHYKTGGANLADQLRLCREYAEQNGYDIVAELPEDDRGVSGAELYPPQLSKALEMARAGQFDVLVVRELDRLARDITKQYIVEQELRQSGVTVEYSLYDFPDSAEGRLQKSIYAAFAEFEREKIKQRMVRGRRRKVRNGEVIVHGNPPYGYRVKDVNGKRLLVLDDAEAQVVRLIFRLYTEGNGDGKPLSMIGVQRYLTAAGIPCPADSCPKRCRKGDHEHTWRTATIAHLLKRQTYLGTWTYGKGGDAPIEVEVPAIISPETFRAARQQAKRNTKYSKRNTRYSYLLQRRLRCAACGRAMSVRRGPHRYYMCSGKTHYDTPDGKPACTIPYFRSDRVDAAAWEWLKELFGDEDALLKALRAQQAQREESLKPKREELAAVNQMLAKREQELRNLGDLYVAGNFPQDWLVGHKTRLDGDLERLGDRKAHLLADLNQSELSEERIQSILELGHYVREGIAEAEETFDKRRWVIELLEATGELAIEDGERVLYLRCVVGEKRMSIASRHTGTAR